MSDDKLEEIAGAFFPESAERFSRCRAAVGRAYDLGRADWDKERERADDHDSARQSEKERADYAEAGLARLKVEYAAAIERGMRATAELQGKVERLRAAVEAWRKAESAVECEACAVFGASIPEGEKP